MRGATGLSLTPYLSRYVFQEEVGASGTPHLQGLIHNKNQVALSTLKGWNLRVHWEATRDIKSSITYCSDPAKRAPGGRIWNEGFTLKTAPTHILDEVDLFDWQKELVQELRQDADERSIIWYCDRVGGSGKTALAKFILTHIHRAMFFSGGRFGDMAHAIIKSKFDPSTIVINLPRTSEGKVSYAAVEAMKDGIIQSGKYEGGWRLYPPPHVVVFANWMPQEDALSADRWTIRELENHRLRR